MKKILILLAFAISFLGADTLKVSSPITDFFKFKYESPQGKIMKIDDDTRTILISFEKDTGKLVNSYLDKKYPPYLSKVNAVFIADISKMPSLITRFFALPKLRKYKHLIYLHYDDEFVNTIPNKEDKVTVIKLKNKKVLSISFISTEAEIKAALEN